MDWKIRDKLLRKYVNHFYVGISDDQQQQQTESTSSSTDTTSAVKPVISTNIYYCYIDLTLHNLHCINFFKV